MQTRSLLLLSFAVIEFTGYVQRSTTSAERKDSSIKRGEIGSRLPEFSLKDLQGREVSSTQLRGKVVLIDFWATSCQPCKREMPGYQALLNKYRSRGFVVIGFKFDTMMDAEDPVRFARKIGVRYPLAVASDDLQQKFGGIEGLPTTLLYDRDGILRKKVIGFEYTRAFEAELTSLF